MEILDRIFKVEWLKSILIVFFILIVLQWLIWPMRVNGRSMEGTLHHLDYMIVSKALTYIDPIDKGDLVILDIHMGEYSERVVKRVIGISGDHVVIKDGKVYVNGEELLESYVQGETHGEVDIIVGQNSVFVLGDNRAISKDSRSYGSIPLKSVRGKVILKFSL